MFNKYYLISKINIQFIWLVKWLHIYVCLGKHINISKILCICNWLSSNRKFMKRKKEITYLKYTCIGNVADSNWVIPRLHAFALCCLHTLNMTKLSVSLIPEIMCSVLHVIQLTNNCQVAFVIARWILVWDVLIAYVSQPLWNFTAVIIGAVNLF